MKKNRLILSAFLATCLSASATEPVERLSMAQDAPEMPAVTPVHMESDSLPGRYTEEPGLASVNLPNHHYTLASSSTAHSLSAKAAAAFNPSIKFGGYIVGKYSINDRDGQASNSSFDLRFVRLYANGYCFNDFYYRLQLEVNGAPGVDKGPRIVDAFIEWQKYDCFRVKLGQFKRSFGFENPYSPLAVGMGSYSQATLKLASINDRIGEQKSSGRDVGVQVQGDLFPAADGHKWLHYQVGLFNGQGINHTDKDNFKDLIGGLWVSPVKDLCIGGFGWNGQYTNESFATQMAAYNANPGTAKLPRQKVDRKRWGVGLKYESDWVVRGEYIASKGGVASNAALPTRSDAWYAMVGVPVMKDLKIYGRWDCYRDAKAWSTLNTNWGLTADYYLGKNLILQANYTFTDQRGTPAIGHHYNTFDIQIYARF